MMLATNPSEGMGGGAPPDDTAAPAAAEQPAAADNAPADGAAKPPRRAQSALNYYSSFARRTLRKQSMTEEQMKQAVLDGWAQLPEAEKQPYEAKAAQDQQRYQQQIAAYVAAGGAPPGAPKEAGSNSNGAGTSGAKLPSTPLKKVNLALLGVSPSLAARNAAGEAAAGGGSAKGSKGKKIAKTPAAAKG